MIWNFSLSLIVVTSLSLCKIKPHADIWQILVEASSVMVLAQGTEGKITPKKSLHSHPVSFHDGGGETEKECARVHVCALSFSTGWPGRIGRDQKVVSGWGEDLRKMRKGYMSTLKFCTHLNYDLPWFMMALHTNKSITSSKYHKLKMHSIHLTCRTW